MLKAVCIYYKVCPDKNRWTIKTIHYHENTCNQNQILDADLHLTPLVFIDEQLFVQHS